jgi:hypothetical protein
MSDLFKLFTGFVPPRLCEALVEQTFAFKRRHYSEENLGAHRAYLADKQPHRTSHAYAVGQSYVEGFTGPLPTITLEAEAEIPHLYTVSKDVLAKVLDLNRESRVLFNVQEYYGGSERVPKHMDGELLEFHADAEGNLDIIRSIRPEKVAVLTLVNDTDGGGTRVHLPGGKEEVIRAQAGDLLVFNNVECYHSVDALTGTVRREDGLLRMTIGWRSLADRVHYYEKDPGTCFRVTMDEANKLIESWYKNEWPRQWENIQQSRQKAAF